MTVDRPILLVEDNPDDAELTRRAFAKNQVANRLVVASDGLEALDYLLGRGKFEGRDTTQRPAVILLDLQLPKLSGIEVLREIRAHAELSLIPIVILTSSKEERDLIETYRLGANSYVQKPVDFNQFIEAVRQLGMYWLMLNEAPPL